MPSLGSEILGPGAVLSRLSSFPAEAPPPRIAETEEWAHLACLRMAEVTVIHSEMTRATGSTATETAPDRGGWVGIGIGIEFMVHGSCRRAYRLRAVLGCSKLISARSLYGGVRKDCGSGERVSEGTWEAWRPIMKVGGFERSRVAM